MQNNRTQHFGTDYSWTLGIAAALLVLNFGLFSWSPVEFSPLLSWLEYDRDAILSGQVWRIITGNLVHWSAEHFLLDIGAFVLVGCLYEKLLGRSYPWTLLFAGLVVGTACFVFLPEMATYRGLSGIDSAQFAAVLCLEFRLAQRDKRNWFYLCPAAAVFTTKLAFECVTGQMFFGTESLGNIGQPVPLAHVAGAVSAVLFLLAAYFRAGTLTTIVCGDALGRTSAIKKISGLTSSNGRFVG